MDNGILLASVLAKVSQNCFHIGKGKYLGQFINKANKRFIIQIWPCDSAKQSAEEGVGAGNISAGCIAVDRPGLCVIIPCGNEPAARGLGNHVGKLCYSASKSQY